VMVCPLVPLDVHTDGVVVENVTARPEDAVAVTVNGDCAVVVLASVPNVMVWFAFDAVNDRLTLVAEPYTALPAWLALTVQVPAVISVMVCPLVPLDVHTDGVVVENVTARPEDAVALTVTGDCVAVLPASVPNVIVWFAITKLFDGFDAAPVPFAFVAVTLHE